MKPIYQWIYRDNSSFSHNKFGITEDFFESEDEIYFLLPNFKESRSIVEKYLPSKISDEKAIRIIKKYRGIKVQ